MKLRISEFLSNVQENEDVAFSAELRCPCGCSEFSIQYKGKQTKGILAPYIVRANNRLAIKAACKSCNKQVVLYDSSTDGTNADYFSLDENFIKFTLPKSDSDFYKLVVKYNYYPENFKIDGEYSDKFENCFIYIIHNRKEKTLIEV